MKSLEIGKPVAGFYKVRLVKGGPFVGVLVYQPCPIEMELDYWNPLDRARAAPRLACLIDGRRDGDLFRHWPFLRPVTRKEYLYLTEAATWDRTYDPASPAANPDRVIDLNELPPIF